MDRAKQFRRAASQENHDRQRQGWRYTAKLRSLAVVRIPRQADHPFRGNPTSDSGASRPAIPS